MFRSPLIPLSGTNLKQRLMSEVPKVRLPQLRARPVLTRLHRICRTSTPSSSLTGSGKTTSDKKEDGESMKDGYEQTNISDEVKKQLNRWKEYGIVVLHSTWEYQELKKN